MLLQLSKPERQLRMVKGFKPWVELCSTGRATEVLRYSPTPGADVSKLSTVGRSTAVLLPPQLSLLRPNSIQPQGCAFHRERAGGKFGCSLSGVHGAHAQHDSRVQLQCCYTSRSAIFWYLLWAHSPVMGTHDLILQKEGHTPGNAPPDLPEMFTLELLSSSCSAPAGWVSWPVPAGCQYLMHFLLSPLHLSPCIFTPGSTQENKFFLCSPSRELQSESGLSLVP